MASRNELILDAAFDHFYGVLEVRFAGNSAAGVLCCLSVGLDEHRRLHGVFLWHLLLQVEQAFALLLCHRSMLLIRDSHRVHALLLRILI